MSIDIACPNCGRLIFAPEQSAGKDLVCPGCGHPVQVVGSSEKPSPAEEPIPVACPNCAASIRLVPKLLGRRVSCNTCRTVLQVSLALQQIDASSPESSKPSHDAAQETMVRARCPCGKQIQTLQSFAAEVAKCPRCGRVVRFSDDEHPHVAQETDHAHSTQHDDHSHSSGKLELEVPETTAEACPTSSFTANLQKVSPHAQVAHEPARAFSEYEDDPSSGDLVFGFPEDALPVSSSPSEPQASGTLTQTTHDTDPAPRELDDDDSSPSDDLAFPFPETADDPFPAGSSILDSQKENAPTQPRQDPDLAFPEPEDDEFDLDFPSSPEEAFAESAQNVAPAQPPPLSAHEVSTALRDERIGAALRQMQSAGPVEAPARDPLRATPREASRSLSPSIEVAPWLGPLAAAIVATCIMLAVLHGILF